MALTRGAVRGLVFLFLFSSLPLFAVRKPDTGSSQNGFFGNCGNGETCPAMIAEGVATLSGTDASGNSVTVTVNLYNWGQYPCEKMTGCNPTINYAVLDVTLAETDGVGIQSVVVKKTLTTPTYVTCGPFDEAGIGCISYPVPDANADVQEPTPIAGADSGSVINTRWDFGGITGILSGSTVPFGQLQCTSDGSVYDSICDGSFPGEAVLVVSGSVTQNSLGTLESDYLVTLTDGTKLGTLAVPASPTTQVVDSNNTQATATVITKSTYTNYIDDSQAYPQMNADGSMSYPEGFAVAPVPPASSAAFPSCYPTNALTGLADTRTFRTAWYSYTPSSSGSVTINTAGSRYDTLVYVFTGSASNPTSIACDDDPYGSKLLQAETTFNATEGTDYQIVVYESPTTQTSSLGYPLSVDGALNFKLTFSTEPPTTTTKVTSSPAAPKFGQSVTLTGTVTSSRPGIITGTVTFTQGATTLGTASLAGGKANLAVTTLPAGTDTVTATYSGDSNFNSSSGSGTVTISTETTSVKVTSSPNPSGLGNPVTFTATITPEYAGSQATGTVTFYQGATDLGSGTVSKNIASFTTSALSFGSDSITATYNGDSNCQSSTSKIFTQTVDYASTTMVSSSSNPSTSGNPVTFTVTVTSSGGTPAGTVELTVSEYIYTLTLAGGTASYTTTGSQLAVGTDVITAVYEGHGKIVGSTATLNQVVQLPSFVSILYSFTGTPDGNSPNSSLVADSAGNLYGTTPNGGTYSNGTVFKINTSNQESILYSFTGTNGDGANPIGGVVLDSTGNLYGVTGSGGGTCTIFYNGCGTVFKLTTAGKETILHSFTGTGGDGAGPRGGLVFENGNLYGTTYEGGNTSLDFGYGYGMVFEITTAGVETPIYSFTGTGVDGAYPEAALVPDTAGNLYGTTYYGGGTGCYGNGCGVVFKVNTSHQVSTFYSFTESGGDGAFPEAGLVFDAATNYLYGTTPEGGTYGGGMVFKISTTGQETPLYSFKGNQDGTFPQANLVLDSSGNLYGTTSEGGGCGAYFYGCGTVFKVDTTNTETVLYGFTDGPDGSDPQGGLMLNSKGDLVGTTSSGGAKGDGTVFQLASPY